VTLQVTTAFRYLMPSFRELKSLCRLLPMCEDGVYILSCRATKTPGGCRLSPSSTAGSSARGDSSINSLETNQEFQRRASVGVVQATSVSDFTRRQKPFKMFLTGPFTPKHSRETVLAPYRVRILAPSSEGTARSIKMEEKS
jgi:hypothetical protein